MKKLNLLLALPIVSLVMTSCVTFNYQVYEVKSSTMTQKKILWYMRMRTVKFIITYGQKKAL